MSTKDPIKVLLVDDWKSVIDGWLRIASKVEDIDIVETASTEEEAREALETQSFDVVVVDMELSRGDREGGLRLIETMSQQPGAPKFLAISGVVLAPEYLVRAARAGAAGYVFKTTADYDRFFDAIREVHSDKRIFPPGFLNYVIDQEPTWLQLTEQEQDIWQLIAEGYKNKEIGAELSLAESTVKANVRELYSKLGVSTRAQATRKWMEDQYGMQEID